MLHYIISYFIQSILIRLYQFKNNKEIFSFMLFFLL